MMFVPGHILGLLAISFRMRPGVWGDRRVAPTGFVPVVVNNNNNCVAERKRCTYRYLVETIL